MNHEHVDPYWMPHRFCFLEDPEVLWTMVVANVVIALAYLAISAWLVRLRKIRPDLLMGRFDGAFAVFILACGIGHAVKVATLWFPHYLAEARWDGVTAAASMVVAVVSWLAVPRIRAMPNANDLARLRAEVDEQKRFAAEALARAGKEAERVAQLTTALERLERERGEHSS